MTIAGRISGSRQRNSTSRLNWGSRSRTHVMVGTSSTSMSTTVSTASPADALSPTHSSG